jgi:hypothetical protein
MKRIRFFSSFGDSTQVPAIYERIHRLCCDGDRDRDEEVEGYGKSYIFTNDEDYTHAVILNTAMPDLKVPKERVIGLAYEPPYYLGLTHRFVEYAIRNIGRYYIGQTRGLPAPFTEGYGFMWHITPPLKTELKEKTKWMSIMISNKIQAPGHRYRHELVQKILETDLPVDIYGRGCAYYKASKDPRFKGEFTEKEPYMDYKYHIAIENFRTPRYFSEKITNPLLCQCKPIYLGCINIKEYFGENVIDLSGNVDMDIEMLRRIYETDGDKGSDGYGDDVIDQDTILEKISFNRCVKEYLND